MMILKLYNFSKKANSTKVPASDTATELNVTLKENVSLYSPSFILSTEPNQFNYCQLDDKYYYINDYVYVGRNTFIINCTLDVLATYKTDILKTKAFVLYSTSNYDSSIPDQRLSQKAECTYRKNSKDLTASSNDTMRGDGYFAVSYIGQPPSSNEPSTVLGLDFANFKNLSAAINSKSVAEFFSTGYMNKLLNNASQAITEVKFIPIAMHQKDIGGSTRQVILGGNCAIGAVGYELGRVEYSCVIPIPWQFTDFRNRSQYTTLMMNLPGVGVVPINPDNYIGFDNITVRALVSEKTGVITYDISGLERYQCDISRNVHISTGSNPGLMSLLSGITSTAYGIATGNYAGAVGSAFNAIGSSFGHQGGSVGGATGNTGYAINNMVTLESCCHGTTIEPSTMAEKYGRPLNKVVTLSTLSGYCQTTDASIEVNASNEIIEEINNLLNGGVYIE